MSARCVCFRACLTGTYDDHRMGTDVTLYHDLSAWNETVKKKALLPFITWVFTVYPPVSKCIYSIGRVTLNVIESITNAPFCSQAHSRSISCPPVSSSEIVRLTVASSSAWASNSCEVRCRVNAGWGSANTVAYPTPSRPNFRGTVQPGSVGCKAMARWSSGS